VGVELGVARLELRDDVEHQAVEQLTHGLCGGLDEDLGGPPVILRHQVQDPLSHDNIHHVITLSSFIISATMVVVSNAC
jgi:hypothetical protein